MADGAGDNYNGTPDGLHHFRHALPAPVPPANADGSPSLSTPSYDHNGVAAVAGVTTETTNRSSPAQDAAAAAMPTSTRPLSNLPLTHTLASSLSSQPSPFPTSISTMLPPPPRDPYVSTPTAALTTAQNNCPANAAAAAAAAAAAMAAKSLPIYPRDKRKQRTSGVWQYFEQFPPLTPGGRNVRCMIMVDVPAQAALGLPQRSMRCGATYTHVEAGGGKGGSGTSGMLNHIANKHPDVYAAMLQASPHLTKSPKVRKTEANKKKKKGLTPPRGSPSKAPFGAPATQPTTPPQTALSGERPHPELSPQPDFRLQSEFSLQPDFTVAQPGRASQADRSLILMCALNTLDPSAVSGSLGLRVFMETLSPACTGRGWTPPPPTMPPAALDETLSELKASVRGRVSQALAAQHDSCRRLGWSGPFVALQVDMVGEHGFEFCTASVAFVAENFGDLTRLAVSARWFRGRVTASSAEAWIRELTSETFKEMCGESDPKQIFLAATVGATSTAVGFPPGNGGAGSAEVKDALRELGVPVVTCFSSRLHAVAMRSLGCASACSPDDFCRSSGDTLGSTGGEDDKQSSSNPKMREILDKATAMIRAFEDWPRRDGGDSELEPLLAELEDLVVMSERAQLACASWTAQHATLESLLLLMEPLDAFFRANPVVDPLLPAEWQAIRETVSILDPATEVVAKFDDPDPGQVRAEGEGSGVPLAEAISLYAHLHQSFVFPTQDIRVDGNCDGPIVSERVENLTPEARLQLGVLSRGMQEAGLGRALEDVEAVSMALHPRLKACSQSACVNGGAALKAQAVAAISAELKKFEGGGSEPSQPQPPTPAAGGLGSSAAKLSRLDKMRKAHDLALGYSIAPGVAAGGSGSDRGVGFGGSSATNPLSGAAADAVRELGEYMVEASAVTGRGLLSFWKLHGTDTRDSGTGKVVLSARWPHLGLVARLYAGVEAVSRQVERHFGGGGNGGGNLGLAVRGLRTSMAPKRVEQMVLLRMNQHLLPEVETFRGRYEAGAADG